jgi:hypothetical protein
MDPRFNQREAWISLRCDQWATLTANRRLCSAPLSRIGTTAGNITWQADFRVAAPAGPDDRRQSAIVAHSLLTFHIAVSEKPLVTSHASMRATNGHSRFYANPWLQAGVLPARS